MGLNCKIGDIVHAIDVRNSDLQCDNLLGLSMTKEFRPSTSNIVGTDLSKYKIVGFNEFAVDFMSAIRVHKMPIALNRTGSDIIVSPAYGVFAVNDEDVVLPEYLMLWFMRPDFDRYADFKSDSAIRGGYDWYELCNTDITLPSIAEQRKIVHNYQVITDRIELLKKLNEHLEDIAYTAYMSLIEEKADECFSSTLGEVATITTGKLNSEDAVNGGVYPFFTCSQEIYRTDSYAFDQEAVLLAGNNASAIYPLNLFEGKFNAYQRTYVISSKTDAVSNKQLYFVIKNKLRDFKEQSYGTATKFLTMTILAPIRVMVPTKEVFGKFSKIADVCFTKIAINKSEIDCLEKVKYMRLCNISKGA